MDIAFNYAITAYYVILILSGYLPKNLLFKIILSPKLICLLYNVGIFFSNFHNIPSQYFIYIFFLGEIYNYQAIYFFELLSYLICAIKYPNFLLKARQVSFIIQLVITLIIASILILLTFTLHIIKNWIYPLKNMIDS